MPRILVSGAVQGKFDALFERCDKLRRKGEFEAVLCVGEVLGAEASVPTRAAPIATYCISGRDAVSERVARDLAARNVTYLGRAGVREIAGLRVAYLSGVHDDEAFPTGTARSYGRDDVEALLVDGGAYVAGGGVDILLTCEPGLGYDEASERLGPGSPPLGDALAELPVQYHFVAARHAASLDPYKVGRGGPRIARLHALPPLGEAPQSIRAFRVEPFDASFDLDTDDGARRAALWADQLRRAGPNPYARARTAIHHKPPPGLARAAAPASSPPASSTPASSAPLDDRVPISFSARGTRPAVVVPPAQLVSFQHRDDDDVGDDAAAAGDRATPQSLAIREGGAHRPWKRRR